MLRRGSAALEPAEVAGFLTGRIPEKVIADDEWLAAVESVCPRWLEFAAECRGGAERAGYGRLHKWVARAARLRGNVE